MARRKPRRRGRPTKLTPDVQAAIVKAVRKGAFFDAAADAAGVHPATAYRWLSAGEDADAAPHFREFRDAVTRARAKAELAMVKAIVQDAQGGTVIKEVHRTWRNGTVEHERQFAAPNGRIALDYLARVHPGRWGKRTADGSPGEVAPTAAGGLRSSVIAALADRLAEQFATAAAIEAGPVIDGEVIDG